MDNIMRKIIVPAFKRDNNHFGIQKYDNNASWNTDCGMTPNGVCATRFVRETSPDIAKLSPLAAWLVEHVHHNCAGEMPMNDRAKRVTLFNGKSEADMMREENPTGTSKLGISIESYIAAYDLENVPTKISDWLFTLIQPDTTDEAYWNNEARKMVSTGAVRIEIGEASFLITEKEAFDANQDDKRK